MKIKSSGNFFRFNLKYDPVYLRFQDLINNVNWDDTGIFPRVTMCDFEVIFIVLDHFKGPQQTVMKNKLAAQMSGRNLPSSFICWKN